MESLRRSIFFACASDYPKTAAKVIAAEPPGDAQIIPFPLAASGEDPERSMAQREILKLVEQATDALPDVYRLSSSPA